MTNQEAVSEALYELKYAIEDLEMDADCPTVSIDTIEVSIEALEKQIPKKPFCSGIFYDCPRCLDTVGHKTPRGRLIAEHHCKCGQTIYWGEE